MTPLTEKVKLILYSWQTGDVVNSIKGLDIDILTALKHGEARLDNLPLLTVEETLMSVLKAVNMDKLNIMDKKLYFDIKRGLIMYGHNKTALRLVFKGLMQLVAKAGVLDE